VLFFEFKAISLPKSTILRGAFVDVYISGQQNITMLEWAQQGRNTQRTYDIYSGQTCAHLTTSCAGRRRPSPRI